MGLAKRMMEEYESRGYGGSDKCVCSDCVGNEHLKQFILENGAEDKHCDFCDSAGVCADIEDLCGEIMEAMCFEYERAIGAMNWNNKEGGYIGATTWDSYDLLAELNDNMLLEPGVLDEVSGMINHDAWCELDPYSLRASKEHKHMWQRFSQIVKHETRYVFFRMPERDNYDEESDYLILDHINEAVYKLGLIEMLPKGTRFYRGRTHDKDVKLTETKDLCTPPSDYARANRMSAEGVPVFYGAANHATVLAEINDGKPYATVAEFVNLRELYILDLADKSKYAVPCLFDAERRHLREPAKFLNELNRDLTRNIEDMKAIEYIPAQVVAEYFRFLYEHEGRRIDGIAYNSSKCPEGTCFVLFFNQKQCLEDVNQQLQINNSTLHNYSDLIVRGVRDDEL